MKTDPKMTSAVLSIARRQYDPKASQELQFLAGFCADVLLPLMTNRANSNAYNTARLRLIERGRNATP